MALVLQFTQCHIELNFHYAASCHVRVGRCSGFICNMVTQCLALRFPNNCNMATSNLSPPEALKLQKKVEMDLFSIRTSINIQRHISHKRGSFPNFPTNPRIFLPYTKFRN